MRTPGKTALVLCAGLCALCVPAGATVVQQVSGLSAEGEAVSLRSEMTISGDFLTLRLYNDSDSTLSPGGLLTSYYFDIVKNGQRPALTYVSAVGDVYQAVKNGPDELRSAGGNLKAVAPGNHTWQFKTFDSTQYPHLGFGVGTAGNSDLEPNNFNGNIVGGMSYGIYSGDVATQNLAKQLLVQHSAQFMFSGLTGYSETDISRNSLFGLGTSPDALFRPGTPVPEPLTIAAVGASLGALGAYIRGRRAKRSA